MLRSSIHKIVGSSKVLTYITKKSVLSQILHKCYEYTYWKSSMVFQRISEIPRRIGFNQKKYIPLKKLKNKYKGKRCFIACTGPSLTISDLELLKNEYVFGMNSLALIHDKTSWKPDFYGIEDNEVYERLEDTIMNTDNGLVFYSQEIKKKYRVPENSIPFYRDNAYHLYEFRHGHYFTRFSNNCYARVFDGYTITHSVIQLAVHLGFKEIYLIGCDCSYLGEKQHFIEHGIPVGTGDNAARLMTSHKTVAKYAKKLGFKVFNATRGGYLEVYPRVNLDEVIASNCNNKIR